MKKLLLIMNPYAGTKQGANYLPEICSIFCAAGYELIVAITQGRGDGTKIARERATGADLVVASGGDGTFNEVVAGVLESGAQVPIGYIPAGTTNDFAASIGLSDNVLVAARDIVNGRQRSLDIGSFNGRYFSYVASFGAFTGTSYSVPQDLKNMLGHAAYILEGVKDIVNIRKVHVILNTDEGIYGNDYIFGAICNSTSMGGILSLKPSDVDMNDGLFEVLLVRCPSNLIELNQVLVALSTNKYDSCPMISFFSSGKLEIRADADMPWTLDGEYQSGSEHIEILNHRSAVHIIVPESS